jgi:hypothetical protein
MNNNFKEQEIIKKILDNVLSIPIEKWEDNFTIKINDIVIYLRVDASYPSGVVMIGDETFCSIHEYKLKVEAYSRNVTQYLEARKQKERQLYLLDILNKTKSL